MPEHFTKSTLEAKFWCAKCHKPTMHYVNDGRRGGCQECIARYDAQKRAALDKMIAELPPAVQESLF